MTVEAKDPGLKALDSLLEKERAALLQGDLDGLADMLAVKEGLIEALNHAANAPRPALKALDAKLRRNQALLDGALEGIREVASRMAQLRRLRNGLETYGSDGRKQNIDVRTDHTLERRA
ncbi:MAG: flagellar biosynthesis protein FlgN [Pseudomonadota bacterium]